MKLLLCDTNEAMCEAWRNEPFFNDPNVTIVCGRFEDQRFDCLVSAANSFGLMDGGIDGAIIAHYGSQLMERVQDYILSDYRGEQPVGTCLMVEILNEDTPIPVLAHTPTMRTPQIIWGDVVYNAMWAMLNAVENWKWSYVVPDSPKSRNFTVCCCGLGTGTGGVPFEEAARQMGLAWRNFLSPPANINWDYALERERAVRASPFASLTV